MPRQQRTDVLLRISALLSNVLANPPGEIAQQKGDFDLAKTIPNGIGDGTANTFAHFNADIPATGGQLDIDVFDFAGIDIGAGPGLDALGQPFQNSGCSLFAIRNPSATEDLLVGNNGTAGEWLSPFLAAGDTVRIKPGGLLLLMADSRYAIVDATNHLLRVESVGAAVPDVEFFFLVN